MRLNFVPQGFLLDICSKELLVGLHESCLERGLLMSYLIDLNHSVASHNNYLEGLKGEMDMASKTMEVVEGLRNVLEME
jgi:hypothetical protein